MPVHHCLLTPRSAVAMVLGQGQQWTSASFPDILVTTTIVATPAAGAGGTMGLLVSGLLNVEEATATE